MIIAAAAIANPAIRPPEVFRGVEAGFLAGFPADEIDLVTWFRLNR
jgi:hypothetical protein